MGRKQLSFVVLGAALAAGGAASAPARTDSVAKRCGKGFADTVVRGRHVCLAAADLRVRATVVPTANRTGGFFLAGAEVTNVGRRSAAGVVVTLEVGGEVVFAPEPAASCERDGARSICRIGTLRPGARTDFVVRTRALVLGTLSLRARATSVSRDARPADNVASGSGRVTEPDSVRGRGVRPTAGDGPRPPVTIEVDAISGPDGDDPAGTFWTKYPGLELRGRVACLGVNGNRASIGGVVEETSSPATNPVGSTIHFGITDNGAPGAGRDLEVTYLQLRDASSCPVPLQDIPEITLIDGDFVVHDER
jgi:Domain of unknown function DUF11